MRKEDAIPDATRVVPSVNAKRRNKQARKNTAVALFDLAGEVNLIAQDFLREDRKVTRDTVQRAKDKVIDVLIFLRHADGYTED